MGSVPILVLGRYPPDHAISVGYAAATITITETTQFLHDTPTGGYDTELIATFDAYARVLAWALLPALVFAALKNVLNAVSRTGAITLLSVGIVLGNIVGSIVLVHGIGARDGLGVAGAAWATVGLNTIAAAVLLVRVVRAGLVRFDAVRMRAVPRTAREIVRLGWAAGAQQALESVLLVVALYMFGLHSTIWLAAGTVVFAVMELNHAAAGAVGEVLSARLAAVGTLGGDVRRLLRLGAGLAGVAAAVPRLTAAVFADATVTLFSGAKTTPEARELMLALLRWTAPFFLFDAW
ncbi:hypothetical protein [uncultured Tateyamaria sp.]|uniref:hypothetical protein n=1 Tax=uncultured Tateyamaria sp. TaxID=455651 RepID=UPI00262160EA|nr:hypothetical protein [uncultured Tateyamaria sp.]